MQKNNINLLGFLMAGFLLIIVACSKAPDTTTPPVEIPSTPGIIAADGMAKWDALSMTEKSKVKGFNSLFLHQSVGGDIEGGCETNGYKPEFYELNTAMGSTTFFYGGLFRSSNGDPIGKFAEFKQSAILNKSKLRLAIFEFGYADIDNTLLPSVKTGYKAMVEELKANGIRVLHCTPPMVFDTTYNRPIIAMGTWMKATFPNDMIFDLQDIESRSNTTGTRCEQGGVWQICDNVRSTPGCPSREQGVDTPAQGHICGTAADKIAKAFLYAIYSAEK